MRDAEIVTHARKARSAGIDFLYLLNGLCRHLDLADHNCEERVLAELEWIIEEVSPTSLVIADPRVARLVRTRYGPDVVGIRVSTIAGVKSVSDLEPWLRFHIDGVVLHHDLGRAYDRIKEIVRFLRKRAPYAEVELLVNESCVHQCFARDAHYAKLALASVEYVEGFQQNCNIPRLLDPSVLLASRWIRPEDLGRYVDLGVRRFKIAGREMHEAWLDRAVSSYLGGSHEGNLVEVFTMTPPGLGVAASDVVFLDNRYLEGFLAGLPTEARAERRYLQCLAAQLWEQGALQLRDPGGRYEVTEGRLRCTKHGRYLTRLQALRVNSDPPFRGPDKSEKVNSQEVRQ